MNLKLPLLAPRVPRPRLCVWEITRACNGLCIHCGSSAGEPRDNELSTAEALALIDQLALLGCQTVTFSGGEPLMREDWPILVRRVRERGLRAELMSNGMLVSVQLDAIIDAGFASVSLSMDGPAEIHDALRGVRGNHARVLAGARALAERGMRVGAVTQVGRLNVRHLDVINEMLVEAGFQGWLVQLTLTYGRAAEHGERLALSPEELPLLEAELLRVIERSPLRIQAADTIGYFSPAEPRLRASADCGSGFWGSCQAGLSAIGITSQGTVRGCLSMPDHFDEDNIRERSLEEIWNDPNRFVYNRQFDVDQLEGACGECAFGKLCRAGCTASAWLATGGTVSNPRCFRAVASAAAGE